MLSREILPSTHAGCYAHPNTLEGNGYAGKSGNQRRQHGKAQDAFKRGNDASDRVGAGGRRAGEAEAGRSVRDTAYRVLQCKQELVEKNGREPTMEEIARAMDVPLEEVVGAMDAIASPVSLYEPVYSDGGDPLTVMDQVRDTKNTDERWLDSIAIRQAISQLSAREKRILALRFYDGRTQMEVAGSIGISQAQVSRLEKNALSAIRRAISVS